MTTDILAEIDYAEVMRHATRSTSRDAMDWLEVRRAILGLGGIGPSRDWDNSSWPGDLYRRDGMAPDLMAVECYVTSAGGAGVIPWGDDASDSVMLAYLQRSWSEWQRFNADAPRRAAKPAAEAPRKLKAGERSYAEFVAELKHKHGPDVDLSGLRSEYVSAYESGERVTVERDGRTYRGTVGATRGPRPRFVLLLSMDL